MKRDGDAETQDNKEEASQSTNDFEAAIAACEFGMFNICLLMVCVPGVASMVFETTNMSYILSSAECDLQMSLLDKGVLNSVTYAGMLLSGVGWGYFADMLGRKQILNYGLLAQAFTVLCASCSQTFYQLLVFKFLGGFIACGPFVIFMSYLSELHGQKHRSSIMMSVGIMRSAAQLVLPIMAYFILPQHIDFSIAGLKFHSWQVFIAATSIPCLISGSLVTLFPESPKFLMSQGRNAEAMSAFQLIYAINTRRPKETYPIKLLVDEDPAKTAKRATITEGTNRPPKRTIHEFLAESIQNLKPLFTSPYLKFSLMVYLMHFLILMAQNSIRLWMPQIFASSTEFEHKSTEASSMCAILEYSLNKTELIQTSEHEGVGRNCDVHITSESYIGNIIVAVASFCGFLLASALVNKVGNKNILSFGLGFSSISGALLYFSPSSQATLIISSLFLTLSSISGTTVISTSVNIFPTAMRTMVVSMTMTCGRLGSLLGNILFPLLIAVGCLAPFIVIGSVGFCAFLISLLLPDTNKVTLK